MLRSALLAASRSTPLRDQLVKLPVTRQVVERFIPGETVEDMVRAVQKLADQGLHSTVDHLGEDTHDIAQADAVADAYQTILTRLDEAGLIGWAEVSVKLTAIGLGLDDGRDLALRHCRDICATAARLGTTVTVDMEDHTVTEETLQIVETLRADFPTTGCVLQSNLRRTERDAKRMAVEGQRVRLTKGAYANPPEISYLTRSEINLSYVRALRTLMDGPGVPLVASHDPVLVDIAQELATRAGRGAGDYEFQFLYGIRTGEQRRLASLGHTVRIYVPFGADWYGYFMRRLAERPANLLFFARALVGRN